MERFEKIYAWNLLTKDYDKPVFQAFGELVNGRALLCVDRGNELALGTWYSKNYPDSFQIEKAKQEAYSFCKVFTDLSSFKLEIGLIPSLKGRLIEKSYLIPNKNIIEVYPAKFTTFLVLGRQIVSLLKSRL